MLSAKLVAFLISVRVAVGNVVWEGNQTADGAVEKRGSVGGIKICTDVNWSGKCGYKVQSLETCIVLKDPWLYTISSFGPDPGTYVTFHSDTKCVVDLGSVMTYPGSGDLRNQGINDRIGSFKASSRPPPNIPPGSGPGSPFDPNKLLTCTHPRQYDANAKCDTQRYCIWTSNNNYCQYKGGDNGVPTSQECASDFFCPGKNVKCVNGLCCALDKLPNKNRAFCPRKDQLDSCCFERITELQLPGATQLWQAQATIPPELRCGC